MKRIIAAALSVLVGAFGYTIVDQSIDDRVTKLESEVVELKDEISAYHSENSTEVCLTTTQQHETTNTTELSVGTKLTKTASSLHKFLVREYSDGSLSFVHPKYYNGAISTTMLLRSNSLNARAITTTSPNDPIDPRETTTKETTTKGYNSTTTTGKGDSPSDASTTAFDDVRTTTRTETTTTAETTKNVPVRESFVYLTDSTAIVSSIDKSTSLEYSYNNEYSQVSKPVQVGNTYVTITYKGYADTSLSGKTISFKPRFIGAGYYLTETITDNVIKEDGSFEFSATYSLKRLYINQYEIYYMEIK